MNREGLSKAISKPEWLDRANTIIRALDGMSVADGRALLRECHEAVLQQEIGYRIEAPEPGQERPEEPKRPVRRAERMFGKREEWGTGTAQAEEAPRRLFKGFLIIKCPHCGKSKATNVKEPSDHYTCWDCGKETPLDPDTLIPVFAKCVNCGAEFKYRTNFTAERFEHSCYKCGSPIDMELNKTGTAYTTIR